MYKIVVRYFYTCTFTKGFMNYGQKVIHKSKIKIAAWIFILVIVYSIVLVL